MSEKYISIGILAFWALISLYFGIGGAVKTESYNQVADQYDFNSTVPVQDISTGLKYNNFAEMMLHKEDQKAEKLFPFLPIMPEFVGIILTACFFGMLGGIIFILREIALSSKKIENTNYISIPILSFFTGLVILGLNYVIPTLLVAGENKIRPITLLFLSLFAGIYVPRFYKFLASITNNKLFTDE